MNKVFKKIWFILGESKAQLPRLLVIVLFSSFLETLGIGLLGPFFSVISNPEAISNIIFLREGTFFSISTLSKNQLIIWMGTFIIIVFFSKSILYLWSKYQLIRFAIENRGRIIKKLNSSYLYGKYDEFLERNSANLINDITYETQCFTFEVLMPILYGFSNLIVIIFLVSLLAAADVIFLISILFSMLPILLIFYLLRNKIKNWGGQVSESYRGVIKSLNHGIGGLKETRVIGCEAYFEEQMGYHLNKYVDAISWGATADMLPRILIETTLATFIVLYLAAAITLFSKEPDQVISVLGVFVVASIRIIPASSQLIGSMGNVQKSRHAVDILYSELSKASNSSADKFSILKLHTEKNKKNSEEHDFSLFSKFKEIKLKNIFYSYPNTERHSVKNISIDFRRGESIAFIGKSGAGKTTLVDIILGLLVPEKGDITVDDTSIYNSLRTWQNQIGYIPQSIFLIDDTIEKNIAFGIPDNLVDEEKLNQSIKLAQLEDFIYELPMGIKTKVGERGTRLSGGQRQRIGIARALYHEREILVLDEATSALDSETEQKISLAIQALAKQKTLIMIAHRLSTVEHCDQVYLLEQGEIVKSGKLDSLMDRH